MTLSNVGTTTVGTTAVLVLPARPTTGRRSIYLRNSSTGTQVITVLFSKFEGPVANAGYVLKPGEYVSESRDARYEPWAEEISAIGSAAGGTLTYVETI